MKTIICIKLTAILLITLIVVAPSGHAMDGEEITPVEAGRYMDIEGVVISRQDGTVKIRDFRNQVYNVVIGSITQIKERKNNPFRGSRNYSPADLLPGLRVEVKGSGNNSGAIAAAEIRFRHDDFILAQTMNTRVHPVENRLSGAESRLQETEQNALRLSGQVDELSSLSNEARSGAKTAQETAVSAMNAAREARTGVQAANERITLLDNYEVKTVTTVHFQVGSATLSEKYKAELKNFAEMSREETGYVIEVAGFASSDGDPAFNRRLSQRRADAVIQYLAEQCMLPLRRFITPMGLGESQPVADNSTAEGRSENRRVEVRLLVSTGLTESTAVPSSPN
ncbi:MAG TPA: OmpA family protein [Acidobacteriota bacterium]|nr:OmpA family protein [Acidobacteriota bacterium]